MQHIYSLVKFKFNVKLIATKEIFLEFELCFYFNNIFNIDNNSSASFFSLKIDFEFAYNIY